MPAPIIKTQNGLTNKIHVYYDLSNVGGEKDHSIDFDEGTKELKVPVVDEKGKMYDKNIIYKFTAGHFKRIGIR